MSLENGIGRIEGVDLTSQNPSRFFENCPDCGERSSLRCGVVKRCYNDLCPSNDDEDYGS